jgi:hypothetical protein
MEPKRKRKQFSPKERLIIFKMYVDSNIEIYEDKDIRIYDCVCCNQQPITLKNFDVGHIEAFSKGGSDDFDNVRPICGNCNGAANNKNMILFQRERYPNAKPIITTRKNPKRIVKISEDPIETDSVYISIDHIDNISNDFQRHSEIQSSQQMTENTRIKLRNRIMAFILLVAVIAILVIVIDNS